MVRVKVIPLYCLYIIHLWFSRKIKYFNNWEYINDIHPIKIELVDQINHVNYFLS